MCLHHAPTIRLVGKCFQACTTHSICTSASMLHGTQFSPQQDAQISLSHSVSLGGISLSLPLSLSPWHFHYISLSPSATKSSVSLVPLKWSSLALFLGCSLLECKTGQSGTTGLITSLSSHTLGFRYNSILFLPPLPVSVWFPLQIMTACLLSIILLILNRGKFQAYIPFDFYSDILHFYLAIDWPD